MKELLRDNLGLKILSLIIALLLWLLVVNVSKPEITDMKTVILEIENQDAFDKEAKTWQIDHDKVKITYRVRSDVASSVKASDFRAYINLQDYSITGSVPVYVEILNGKDALIDDVAATPQVIKVSIEDIQEKKFTIDSKVTGNPADGFTIAATTTSPEVIYATGPVSEIGRIFSIGIVADVSGLEENKDGSAKPIFYDANGNEIQVQNVKLSQEDISYSVTVHKKKSVNLLSSVSGLPAEGFRYESTTVSPGSIELASTPVKIDSMNSFDLPVVDIEGASENVVQTFDIRDYLPTGVELAQQDHEVTVTVRIEPVPEPSETESGSTGETEEGPGAAAAENTKENQTAETRAADTAESVPETEETLLSQGKGNTHIDNSVRSSTSEESAEGQTAQNGS